MFNSSLLKLILSKAFFVLFWLLFVSSVYFSTITVRSNGKIIKIDINVFYIYIGYLLIYWYIPIFTYLFSPSLFTSKVIGLLTKLMWRTYLRPYFFIYLTS